MGLFWHWRLQIDGRTYDARVMRIGRITWDVLLDGEKVGKISRRRVWSHGVEVTTFHAVPRSGTRFVKDDFKTRNRAAARLVADALSERSEKPLTLDYVIDAMVADMAKKMKEEEARMQFTVHLPRRHAKYSRLFRFKRGESLKTAI